MDQTPLTRRAVVAGGCGLAAAAALTACSGYGASGPVTASAPSAAPNEAASTAGGNAASPGAVAAVADVPVGGGIVLADQDLVVTQPVAGTFKGFSAVCTHQGCVVSSVSDGKINCACHGSVYSAADGSVERGPAPAALAPVDVTVSGDQITLA